MGWPAAGFFGECMVELRGQPPGPLTQGFAGDSCNTAVYYSRLLRGEGVPPRYVTATGDDPFSTAMNDFLLGEGIDCRAVLRLPGQMPGLYHIALDARGERTFSYWRGESACRRVIRDAPPDFWRAQLAELDLFYLTGISLAILPDADRQALLELLRAAPRRPLIVFDTNYRPRLWESPAAARRTYEAILELSGIALVTQDDCAGLFDQPDCRATLDWLKARGVAEAVVRQGGSECLVYSQDIATEVPPRAGVHPVDTTGAGDAFNAAYLAARHLGADALDAAAAGHQLAGEVIQHPGAIIPRNSMPSIALNNKRLSP